MNWQEFESEVQLLSQRISYRPDLIVAVVRGGLVPARLLSSYLGVKEMQCLTVKKIGSDRKVVTEVTEDLTGKKILLVEDILETGKSLEAAQTYLEAKGAEVKTTCLYTTPVTSAKVDYTLREIEVIPKFPWEA